MASSPLICITSTWDCNDLIEPFLSHLFSHEVDLVLVSEYGSTDGTRELLHDSKWGGRVKVVDIELHDSNDCTNNRLQWLKNEVKEGWCILSDPDEFIVPNTNSLKNKLIDLERNNVSQISVPRFNMTAPQTTAQTGDFSEGFLSLMRYRIEKRITRSRDERLQDKLVPSWIFSKILDKVIFRLEHAELIHDGDHGVITREAGNLVSSDQHGIIMQHYPIRTWSQFEQKVRLAKKDFENNTYPPGSSWHWRRWVNLLDEGKLWNEYLEQFIPDELIESYVCDEVLTYRTNL